MHGMDLDVYQEDDLEIDYVLDEEKEEISMDSLGLSWRDFV